MFPISFRKYSEEKNHSFTDVGNSSICKPLEAIGCSAREQGKIDYLSSLFILYRNSNSNFN